MIHHTGDFAFVGLTAARYVTGRDEYVIDDLPCRLT
jgi:hypothetical protein